MASTLLDLVQMTVSSAFGTSSTIPLGNAATVNGVTYLSFANAGATGGSQVSYSILDTANSEIGTATYTSSNTTLTNRTPTQSTNGSTYISASSAALILACVRGEDLNDFIEAGQLLGTATNDSASAGNVGEFTSVVVTTGTGQLIAANGTTDVTALTLTPGDWDVMGMVGLRSTGTQTAFLGWSSSQSATQPADSVGNGSIFHLEVTFPTNTRLSFPVGTARYSIASSTNIYLSVAITGSSGTLFGYMAARRAR